MEIAYKTTATGGRDGRAATADGSLELKLSTPKELGGPDGDGNHPEQLFAAGYSACFRENAFYQSGRNRPARQVF